MRGYSKKNDDVFMNIFFLERLLSFYFYFHFFFFLANLNDCFFFLIVVGFVIH